MNTISLQDLAHDPGALLDRVEAGEHLVVIRAGRPVAELRPITSARLTQRPYCSASYSISIR
jgi:antitoxin (DNA-binding transcriptional repressor) of toxin-antitoxin stability system